MAQAALLKRSGGEVSSLPAARLAYGTRKLSIPINGGIAATGKIIAEILGQRCKILGLEVVFDTTLVANGANFWQISLRNETAGADIITAAASQIKSSAVDFTAYVPYSHDLAAAPVVAAAGAVLTVVFTKNAAAANLSAGRAAILIEEA